MFNGNLVSVHSTAPAIHHAARIFRQPGGVTESSTARAVLTWPLQAAAVPAARVITPCLSLTHLSPQLLLTWSRTLLSQIVLTDADEKSAGECCPPQRAQVWLEVNTQAALMSPSPWESSCSRVCKAKPCTFPWDRFIVTPVYRAQRFSSFPGGLKWGPWGTYGRCLHYDPLCPSCCICIRFQCQLLPLGMVLRNPECKVHLRSGRSWPTFFSFFFLTNISSSSTGKGWKLSLDMHLYKQSWTAHIYI